MFWIETLNKIPMKLWVSSKELNKLLDSGIKVNVLEYDADLTCHTLAKL